MTISIGASSVHAIADHDSVSAKSLLDLADRCLYKSKNGGRNRATLPDVAQATWNWGSGSKAMARA